jgi:asparagine synthase (glutamine-hydrolysing)
MSMMMGVEARVPFLDDKIVEFGVNLPKHCLFNRRSYFQKMPDCKYLLKCVAERYLPDEIVHRNKVGFGLPPSWWRDGESDSETGEYKSIFYDIWSSRLHSDVRTV